MANILIVDDNMVIRRFMKTILQKEGYTVVAEAENGKEAIEQYVQHKPDIVLLDITMPVINGIEALKKIMSFDSNAKVIMVTALEEKNKIFEAVENGAKQYIVKPINPDIVYEKIEKVLKM